MFTPDYSGGLNVAIICPSCFLFSETQKMLENFLVLLTYFTFITQDLHKCVSPFPCPPRTTYLVALIRNDFRHCSEHLESIQRNTGNNFTWANHLNILLRVAFYWSVVFSVLWSVCMYAWDFFFFQDVYLALSAAASRESCCVQQSNR